MNWREVTADQNIRLANKMLEQQQGEINDLKAEVERLKTERAGWGIDAQRYAENFENWRKEVEQLRYERRLLGFARMTLDLIAAGDISRWDEVRTEAEDIAQRIVDEIGHPATDEPALGLSFRAEIERLRELGAEVLKHFHIEHSPEGEYAIRTCWVEKEQVVEWRRAFARDETQTNQE